MIKTMLLDGGYYLKTEWYVYEALRSEKIDSLQSEIDYYIKDFDEYCFDTLEDGKYKYHANCFTATGAIKSMYYYPLDSIYHKLPSSIYLLQSTLPESMNEYRETLVEKFKNSTGSKVKKIYGAGHMLHWDKPNEVAKEIFYWFK